jgi:hypothetical protein
MESSKADGIKYSSGRYRVNKNCIIFEDLLLYYVSSINVAPTS